MRGYHQLTVEAILKELGSSKNGLGEKQVQKNRSQFGWNELPKERGKSKLVIFIRQFKSLMVMILLAAALISFLTQHFIDVYVILAVVLANALIGFSQEIRAQNAVIALQKMLVQHCRVIRDGKDFKVPIRELVPGDVIILEEGNQIPADARIIQSNNLRTVESSLTGESVPENKQEEPLPIETPLADQTNMLWKGTFVVAGYGEAVVCQTGRNTALGKVAESLSVIKPEKTNFQRKTDRLARQMALIAFGSTLLIFVAGYLSDAIPLKDLWMISIAVMVAAIPEGLPAVLSVVMAIGSFRMSKKNAIIREITSVETLGAVTTIITDKTGTLTQNKLTVTKMMVLGEPEIEVSGNGWAPEGKFQQNHIELQPKSHPVLAKVMAITHFSNNAEIRYFKEKENYELVGDPTEGALRTLAEKSGALDSFENWNKIDDQPFDSKLKLRATLCQNHQKKELLVVGAPEKLLTISHQILTKEGVKSLDDSLKREIETKLEEWSSEALRVIGLAYKEVNNGNNTIREVDIGDLVFVGLVGMIDPPRKEVREAVEKCKKAGIRVIMATGDHVNTAIAISQAIGILEKDKPSSKKALTESELEKMDDEEFDQAILKVQVLARLNPEMKLKVASRLQEKGELVAMTGDGVNDAPALKKADVGVSMGIMGTDVARAASKVVLADDNFATIVNAVEEGRIVFSNARKTSFFLVTTNFAEIVTLVILIAMGQPMPLTAIQILWLNLVTDGVGNIALATEKGHGDMLKEKPLKKREDILNKKIFPFLLIMVSSMSLLCLGVFFWFIDQGIEKARTAVFITMAMTQLYNLYNMRSLKKATISMGYFTNKYINFAFILSLLIQILIIEIPFFQEIFDFSKVNIAEFSVLVILSSTALWMGEIYKAWIKKQTKLPENLQA
ncbi:HAD-IC family P-type ATPase [Echinicola jeungdonensis]|uniref:Cation-translocating P-type ATPase n=1 Tax=Echinicola jeungdonensis TaxID=709343 RepID=A0ABV5JAT8_9BACT|nr:HAD-IC family P-type ATPase [Echinicola jeungdonensis]MDN3670519.1 HAD-IC family P-type ATPase [Echinicola jeungdonensis]